MKIQYILDWPKKIITNNGKFETIILKDWDQLKDLNLTVYCSAEDFVWIKAERNYSAQLSEIVAGTTIIKPLSRGATSTNPEGLGTQALKKCFDLCPDFISEHPSHDKETFLNIGGWQYPPRFETFQHGTFAKVWRIDYRSFYANIMRDYPLPYGEPIHLKDPALIEKELAKEKSGFVRFYLKHGAKIKKEQIPFIPDYNNVIGTEIKGRLLLHTRLFKTFKKQYKIRSKIIYTDFWMWEEKKGCVDPFLDYCDNLRKKKETNQEGKGLVNAFWAVVGKNNFQGYNYRAWSVAVRHLAILRLYNLYRLFDPQKLICLRGDEIYVQDDLPDKLNQELFHCRLINKLTVRGNNLYNHDLEELKSFTQGAERTELIKEFENE